MSTATTARSSPRTPWASHSQARGRQISPTTPLGLPTRTPISGGQVAPPLQSAKARSPLHGNGPRPSSPNYFGFTLDQGSHLADSNPGGQPIKSRSPTAFTARSNNVTFTKDTHPAVPSNFEAFRKQSESHTFNLSHGNLSQFSMNAGSEETPILAKPLSKIDAREDADFSMSNLTHEVSSEGREPVLDPMDIDSVPVHRGRPRQSLEPETSSFFGMPRNQSPAKASPQDLYNIPRNQASNYEERHPRLSMPPRDRLTSSSNTVHLQRAETLPSSLNGDGPIMITPQDLVERWKSFDSKDVLLLDLRVFPHYSHSRISGAINLCIPTTLLKRPSFNVQKLAETFTNKSEKERFEDWREAKFIVVYDASSAQLKDATSSVNTLKKFTNEGWRGSGCVVRGGFLAFSKVVPHMVDKRPGNETETSTHRTLSIDPQIPVMAPVAGGCPMPSTQTAANPFFGNIRQNMDLIGGVGQMAVQHPLFLKERAMAELPAWLRHASDEGDKGKIVADRFLEIEKAEQQRMQKALTGSVSYGKSAPSSAQSVQVAGIEKGTKNRYKDILPYDHSRVRLQNVPSGGCDYVNASHIKAEWSHRHYIASQAPVPATFEDFWRVVWEQDARVIVMLTAETEGGQRKCHPYWDPGQYGSLKVRSLSEKRVPLQSLKPPSTKNLTPPSAKTKAANERPSMSHRRSTNPSSVAQKDVPRDKDTASLLNQEAAHVVVRKLDISNSVDPLQPVREITQVQYSNWPDFGTPAHPAQVLEVIEHCGAAIRSYITGTSRFGANSPAMKGERPVVVHCSAGCGRTGTFCTVDSVIDMLKRQRMHARKEGEMDADGGEQEASWVRRDDVDLVAKTVEDFRVQRLSMVQTLRQFVLCYETVLEWLAVTEMPGQAAKSGGSDRRSHLG